jgi:hypothetical protein
LHPVVGDSGSSQYAETQRKATYRCARNVAQGPFHPLFAAISLFSMSNARRQADYKSASLLLRSEDQHARSG